MDASVSSPQQVPTSSTSTGNPQDISQTNLQTPSQGSGLQNAGSMSIEALNTLDQGNAVIPLAASTTTATVTQTTAPQPTVSSENVALYVGISLVVVVFMASLIYGLFYKKR